MRQRDAVGAMAAIIDVKTPADELVQRGRREKLRDRELAHGQHERRPQQGNAIDAWRIKTGRQHVDIHEILERLPLK